jgi:hypothetical protein
MIQPVNVNTNIVTYNQFDNDNTSFQEVLCSVMFPSNTLSSLAIDFGNSTNKKVFQEERSYDKNVPIKYELKRKEKSTNSLYFFIALMFIILLYIIL